MSNGHTILVESPVSTLSEQLGIDYREFFGSLGKATISGLLGYATGSPEAFGNAVKEVIGAYSAFNDPRSLTEILDKPEQLAWVLIHESLIQAICDLVVENEEQFRTANPDIDELPTPEEVSDELEDQLDLAIEEQEVRIDDSFFDDPKALDILNIVQGDLSRWFMDLGLSEPQAHSISGRLPSYFLSALIEEWREHSSDYARLEETFSVPFIKASKRERAWQQYRAFLQKQVDEPVFAETFGLRQIYIPPRAYYVEKEEKEVQDGNQIESNGRRVGHPLGMGEKRIVVWLNEVLESWVEEGDKEESIRVISGGPGSGKSSFAKMFAARLAEKRDISILYIPLHLFDVTGDLEESVSRFIRDATPLPYNPLDPDESGGRLLIIFDGLDELAMRGSAGEEIAKQFIEEVQQKLHRYNMQKLRVQVLLSGREFVVQDNASKFRKPRQMLHLLPYFISENKRDRYDGKDLLEEDQREVWWRKYGELSGHGYETLPEDLKGGRLDEITAQPLLNYLVALSYDRGNIDFSKETSLNAIYQDLLDGVYERDYDFGPHPAAEGVDREGFIRVLEEIALDAWHHGDGRTTTRQAIESRCENNPQLKKQFEAFSEGVRSGVTRLMTAFYFRHSGRALEGEKTFEFTHKSFAEYLTARRIVRTVDFINSAYQAYEQGDPMGRSPQECLKLWAQICGPSPIDRYVFEFLKGEVHSRHNQGMDVLSWQQTFIALINDMLRRDLPLEKLQYTFSEMCLMSSNAKEALLAVLYSCALVTEVTSDVKWPNASSLWKLISELTSRRDGTGLSLFKRLLSQIDMSGCGFMGGLLWGVNMRKSILKEASFLETNMTRSNFSGSDFEEADFTAVELMGSEFENANLRGAIFSPLYYMMDGDVDKDKEEHTEVIILPDLRYVNLHGADLRDATFRRADLRSADLRETQYEGAEFIACKFDSNTQMGDKLREYIEVQEKEKEQIQESQ